MALSIVDALVPIDDRNMTDRLFMLSELLCKAEKLRKMGARREELLISISIFTTDSLKHSKEKQAA